MKYHLITKSLMVKQINEPIFSNGATEIALEDEAAGLFVVLIQRPDDGEQKVSICKEEWPFIRDAIEQLMEEC